MIVDPVVVGDALRPDDDDAAVGLGHGDQHVGLALHVVLTRVGSLATLSLFAELGTFGSF